MNRMTRLLWVLCFLSGCPDSDPDPAPVPDAQPDVSADASADVADADAPDTGPLPPLFAGGCPTPGVAEARIIADPALRMSGPDGSAGVGDALLINEHAAFVVSAIDNLKTYWAYGGILIDAVALDGCAQAGEERFEELVPLLGHLDVSDFIGGSVLRGFRGESIEILNDGADGEAARVRVHGVDDMFWLVELTLVAAAFESGKPRTLSGPMGVEVWIDYILPPDSSVLRIEFNVQNTLADEQPILVGTALWLGDSTQPFYKAHTNIDVGGFGIDLGLPWLATQGPDGALAFNLPEAEAGTLSISGVRGFLDLGAAIFGAPVLDPVGGLGDTLQEVMHVSVGKTDANSATRALQPLDDVTIGELLPIEGVVADPDGVAVAGVIVDVEIQDDTGWGVLDKVRTDADGRFSGEIASFDEDRPYRLVVQDPSRDNGQPTPLSLPADGPIDIEVGRAGTLTWDVRDEDGAGIPARVMLFEGTSMVRRTYADSTPGEEGVPPGDYTIVVMRGYEYEPVHVDITIPDGGQAHVEATMKRAFDTTGWVSADSHIHAGPSSDSDVDITTRVLTAAANGLEIAISTDHEVVSDWSVGVAELGLDTWIRTVIGEEVTATLPEHMNMFPVPAAPDHPRGDPVIWYGLDIEELTDAMRDRGAGVVQLNHPKAGCNYLCLIGWDRVAGAPSLQDPTALGFKPDAALWTWDIDAVELMNSNKNPFLNPDKPESSGLFDDWLGWHNLGHRITAVGVTDTHGHSPPGSPRTYLALPTDEPSEVTDDQLTNAYLEGRAFISTGAFARVTINETAGLGDTITDTDGTVALKVQVQALEAIDVQWISVFANCDEIAKVAADAPDSLMKLDTVLELEVAADATIVVAGFGTQAMPLGFRNFSAPGVPRFMTNPIFVDTDGNGAYDPPGGKECAYSIAPPAAE